AGLFRPVLLLPPGLGDLLADDDLYAVIRHELAHAQRREVLCGFLVTLATRLHWFNPLVWLAAARYRTERELACDERVLALTRDRAGYGRTILKLLERFPARGGVAPAGAIGMVGGRRAVRRRIAAIAPPPVPRPL